MEITSFKVKSRILPVLTFVHSKFNIWSYRHPIDANSIVLDSWIKFLQTPNFSQIRCHMREIWFCKDDNWILPANRFHEETSPNYILKHQNRHPSFNFRNLAPQVNQSRRSRKAATNLKPPTSNHQPQTSRQPPATSRQPPSHYHHLLMFTLELWFFLLIICV
jgi:hypothetical protein